MPIEGGILSHFTWVLKGSPLPSIQMTSMHLFQSLYYACMACPASLSEILTSLAQVPQLCLYCFLAAAADPPYKQCRKEALFHCARQTWTTAAGYSGGDVLPCLTWEESAAFSCLLWASALFSVTSSDFIDRLSC